MRGVFLDFLDTYIDAWVSFSAEKFRCLFPASMWRFTNLTPIGDEPRSWSACSSAVLLRRQHTYYEMDIDNEDKRLGFGTQDRPTGGVVPAPGESSSCDGLTAGLPTGPAVELATVRIEPAESDPGADDLAPETKKQGEPGVAAPSLLQEGRKELRLCLDPREVGVVASTSAGGSAASGSASSGRVLRSGRGPRMEVKKNYPSEVKIKVVAGEIVNSPVTESGSAGGGPSLVRDAGGPHCATI